MDNLQKEALLLENLGEFHKGNPVIAKIHAENPDMIFPQAPNLVKLKDSPNILDARRRRFADTQADLAATSSHTPPSALTLDPHALSNYITNLDVDEKRQRKALSDIKEVYGSQTPKGGLCRSDLALAYEIQPYLTPREVILEQIASMPRNTASMFQTKLKSSEVDAFVLHHEVGHKLFDDLELKVSGKLVGAENSPEIKALQDKNDQVYKLTGVKEPYGRYLEESFSDTYAALQHLKNGGDVAFLQTVSDAREHGVMENANAYIYPTHTSLKHIVENAETLQQKLAGASQQEIVEMTAGIVGTQSYDREEYYEHAMVAQAQAISENQIWDVSQADWEEVIEDKYSPVRSLWQGYCSSRPKGFLAMFSGRDENVKSVDQFVADAYAKHIDEDAYNYLQAKCRLTNAPVAYPDHLRAELLGQLKYVVSKHPESSPEEVLRAREAYLREQYKESGSAVPRDVQFINEDVRDHLEAQRAERREREMAVAITRVEREPDHDFTPAPAR